MKRVFPTVLAAAAAVFAAAVSVSFTAETRAPQAGGPAAAVFKVPFEFKAAGKKIPAGEYRFALSGEGKLVLRRAATGKEMELSFLEKLQPPAQASDDPRLVFDEVGDFAPSYTEYFTVYVLAEVWLSAKEGYLINVTKGAHKEKTVTGEPAVR